MRESKHRPRVVTTEWRPVSYWDLADPVSAILLNVKGQVRRTALRAALEGEAPELPIDPLMREELPDDERRAWGSFHPECMGGEYLPGYLPREVEIARIVFASVTRDVISIRARCRRRGTRIHYRVVDEYPEDHTFSFTPRSSSKPLTLGVLLELIWNLRIDEEDSAEGFLQTCLGFNLEGGEDPESTAAFIRVESLIYPELGRLVGDRLAAWIRQACPAEAEEPDAADREGEE